MIDLEHFALQFLFADSEVEDIRACLLALYSIREGTQPLDRDLGLSGDFMGKPLPVAQNELALEIIKKTRDYEPRVNVREVKFKYFPESGSMRPVVYLERGVET